MNMQAAVVGMGYVGIPVALMIAEAGFDVIGLDIDERKITSLNEGKYPIEGEEPGIQEMLERSLNSGRFAASSDYGISTGADFWLVCVQTPFDVPSFSPNLFALEESVRAVASNMKPGCVVIIESTIPPRTMEDVVIPILEKESGMKAGVDFGVGHCPERVMPGKLINNLRTYGRALGAIDENSHNKMESLYSKITVGELRRVDLKTAEVVKTFENTYRDAEIAIANDFAMYCDYVGVDFFEVRDLVNCVEEESSSSRRRSRGALYPKGHMVTGLWNKRDISARFSPSC